MATSPIVPPPPGGSAPDQSSPAQPMTSPPAVSPDPQQSGGMANQAAFSTLNIVQNARSLAQQFPSVAPEVRQINDLCQKIQMKIAQQADSGQPAAPPIG